MGGDKILKKGSGPFFFGREEGAAGTIDGLGRELGTGREVAPWR
jgi:hypothetical protein